MMSQISTEIYLAVTIYQRLQVNPQAVGLGCLESQVSSDDVKDTVSEIVVHTMVLL